jgi:eukaryotic-like serine/threonine-protein kinase
MSDDVTRETLRCVSCGRPLQLDAPEGLCPVCLLTLGSGSAGDPSAPTISRAHSSDESDETSPRLHQGSTWGDYRVGRLLGRGGMGEVYEAEQLQTGRRLALKVLRRRLHRLEDRARFLREGQLAASVSHPHTVYIFGSEEIAGMPVITMELLTGGTLKDRVAVGGPLAPADAAAAVLDVVGGLDAAFAAGILHRDVKPSNCFVDHEGSVKIGDFGLSISTLSRDVRFELAQGGFQGTPQFAAPEQLRGEPLDVRADIYAVGATLYYLLTGRPPFEETDLRDLIARVNNEPAPSPRAVRREIAPGLAGLVLQCLSKLPSARPQSYAALAEALRPYARPSDAVPGLGARTLAGVVDVLIIGVPLGLIGIWLQGHATPEAASTLRPSELATTAWVPLVGLLYFLILEGTSGASVGKRLFGLRVVSASGPPSFRRVLIRTLVFFLPGMVLTGVILWRGALPVMTFANIRIPPDLARVARGVLFRALLFLPARRRTGWRALQDLVSGTQVVSRPVPYRRRVREPQLPPALRAPEGRTRPGPFVVIADVGATDRGILMLAFDPILRRDVWIHQVSPGDPPTSATRRDVSRIGRLHWLAGRRGPDEHWDAFEAPSGRPLLAAREPVDWPTLRMWMMDVADELVAAEGDGTLSEVSLAQVWLRDDGHVALLDFHHPLARQENPTELGAHGPVRLLAAVAAYAMSLTPGVGAFPLSVLTLTDEWRHGAAIDARQARAQLAALAGTPDRVTPARRALPIAISSLPLVCIMTASLIAIPSMRTMRTAEHANTLQWLDALITPAPGSRLLDPDMHQDAERYVAERFRASLSDEQFWRTFTAQRDRQAIRHDVARRLLARYPADAQSLPELTARLAPEIERADQASRQIADSAEGFVSFVVATSVALVTALLMIGHIVSSLLVPGGVVTRFNGLAMVTADGHPLSRARSLCRVLLAWSPALLWFIALAASRRTLDGIPLPPSPMLLLLTYLLLAAGAIATVVHPRRGPHDTLARTWVIPR